MPRQIKTGEWYRGQSFDVWGESWRSGEDTHGDGRRPFLLQPEHRRETQKLRAAYAHSSVGFIRNERIPTGWTNTCCAKLGIRPEPLLGEWESTVSWSLVTTVDVVRARDFEARELVNLTYPERTSLPEPPDSGIGE